jgi:hypothetical protein
MMSGLDNPPVFILSDQNFPSMVPVGWEGECLKLVLAGNGSLTEQLEVFLGMTRGFNMLAGTVVLLASASQAAAVGTADYAAEFIQAFTVLRGAFTSGVTVIHGIPFLLGGTKNSTAIRALAELSNGFTALRLSQTTSPPLAKHLQQACALTKAPQHISMSSGYHEHRSW